MTSKRVEFSKQMLQIFDDGEINLDCIVSSDEAHLLLSDCVNEQNSRFWESENPHVALSKPPNPLKDTV